MASEFAAAHKHSHQMPNSDQATVCLVPLLSPQVISRKRLAVADGPIPYKLIKDIFNLNPLIFFTFAIPVAINPSLGKHFTNCLRL